MDQLTARLSVSRGFQGDVKVAPQLLDLSVLVHLVHDLVRQPTALFAVHVLALKDALRFEESLIFQVLNHPFVKVEAPVCQRMCHFGIGSAGSATVSAVITVKTGV